MWSPSGNPLHGEARPNAGGDLLDSRAFEHQVVGHYAMMQYKGYFGNAVFDDQGNIFHGEVLGIKDVVTFQGESVPELRNAFQDSVDDYLEFCRQRGESPDKPFSGRFVLRVPADLHRKIFTAARASGQSLNSWVVSQLERQVTHSLGSLEAVAFEKTVKITGKIITKSKRQALK